MFGVRTITFVFTFANLATSRGLAQPALERPAAAVWHEASQNWFVSSMAGSPLVTEPDGWISRIPRRDVKVEPVFVGGLQAPRGIATLGDILYVAEVEAVAVISVSRRIVERRQSIPKARRLSGVAVDGDGNIYVSDLLTNTIHVLPKAGQPQVFLKSKDLAGPNGLWVDGTDLLVASWGTVTDGATLQTLGPGHLQRIDLKTRRFKVFDTSAPTGRLSGVARSAEGLVVTDAGTGRVLLWSADGKVTTVREGLKECGMPGINAERGVLAVPEMGANDVVFVPLR
jgi:sugar lactone lactonase YvrE